MAMTKLNGMEEILFALITLIGVVGVWFGVMCLRRMQEARRAKTLQDLMATAGTPVGKKAKRTQKTAVKSQSQSQRKRSKTAAVEKTKGTMANMSRVEEMANGPGNNLVLEEDILDLVKIQREHLPTPMAALASSSLRKRRAHSGASGKTAATAKAIKGAKAKEEETATPSKSPVKGKDKSPSSQSRFVTIDLNDPTSLASMDPEALHRLLDAVFPKKGDNDGWESVHKRGQVTIERVQAQLDKAHKEIQDLSHSCGMYKNHYEEVSRKQRASEKEHRTKMAKRDHQLAELHEQVRSLADALHMERERNDPIAINKELQNLAIILQNTEREVVKAAQEKEDLHMKIKEIAQQHDSLIRVKDRTIESLQHQVASLSQEKSELYQQLENATKDRKRKSL